MNDLLVLTFDNEEAADGARRAVRDLQHQGLLALQDAAVLNSDSKGKVHVHNELSRDLKVGAGVGAFLGVLFSFLFPFIGLAIGTVGGGLVGALTGRGVDQKFVNEVKDALKPNTSALFLVIDNADMNALRASIAPFQPNILQTTLDEDVADQIRRAAKS